MNFRSLALAAFSGILLAVAFPAFDLHFLAWIALLPLFFALKGQSVKNGFWLGGISGIAYFVGTVYWVTNSMHVYGGIPIVPASLLMLLLSAYLALYPAVFGAAAVHIRKNHPSLFFIAAPALWTALELARTYAFSGFPWSLLGYSQYLALPVVQIADITGVYGVSFLIVLVNAALAEFILDRKSRFGLIVVLFAMMLVLGYGFVKLRTPAQRAGITVSVVQGNIAQDKKWDSAFQGETLAEYKQLTREALKEQPDLVIWPETATPFYFSGAAPMDQVLTADLVSFVKQNRVSLLFGSPTYEVKPNKRIIGRNSAFLLSADGRVEGAYHKIHLVPFGEYVPLRNVLFFVGKMVQAIGDFQAGNEYTVMTVPVRGNVPRPDVKVSTVICYEIIFPDLVRRFVDKGANVITTVTNDAWFGRTAAPYQHFSMAVFRAVENRVPVARAANTGVSGFIDAQGHILAASGIFTRVHLTHTLVPGAEKTFYTRFGDLFAYACVLASLIMLVWTPKNPVTLLPRRHTLHSRYHS
ncbi:MAG: apolipoprotein N-acyltransferase [Nitrospirae bacterium]|nr:apolipoprotein N-acyltransferase [Nitrospirota bacterium]